MSESVQTGAEQARDSGRSVADEARHRSGPG